MRENASWPRMSRKTAEMERAMKRPIATETIFFTRLPRDLSVFQAARNMPPATMNAAVAPPDAAARSTSPPKPRTRWMRIGMRIPAAQISVFLENRVFASSLYSFSRLLFVFPSISWFSWERTNSSPPRGKRAESTAPCSRVDDFRESWSLRSFREYRLPARREATDTIPRIIPFSPILPLRSRDFSRVVSSMTRKPFTARSSISAVKQALSIPMRRTYRRNPGECPSEAENSGMTGFLGGSFPHRSHTRT